MKTLKSIVENATQGSWYHTHIFDGEEIITSGDDGQDTVAIVKDYNNAKFIATFNPEVVLELLHNLESKTRLIKSICEEWNETCNDTCDSYAHDESCKAINITEAKKAMKKEIEDLKAEKAQWEPE